MSNDKLDMVKKKFVGVTRIQEAIEFTAKKIKEGYDLDSCAAAGNLVEVCVSRENVEVKSNEGSVESSSLPTQYNFAEDLIEAMVSSPEEGSFNTEDVIETKVTIETPPVVDWEYAESLTDSKELEAYFEPLGFNANPNHRPKTIIKKAKEHFGV